MVLFLRRIGLVLNPVIGGMALIEETALKRNCSKAKIQESEREQKAINGVWTICEVHGVYTAIDLDATSATSVLGNKLDRIQ